jgi:hypothetical protein
LLEAIQWQFSGGRRSLEVSIIVNADFTAWGIDTFIRERGEHHMSCHFKPESIHAFIARLVICVPPDSTTDKDSDL